MCSAGRGFRAIDRHCDWRGDDLKKRGQTALSTIEFSVAGIVFVGDTVVSPRRLPHRRSGCGRRIFNAEGIAASDN